MTDFIQLPLPGFPVRIVLSAVWESAERPCTIRATVDAPTDDLSSQFIGSDTEGRMTWDELSAAMELLLDHVMRRFEEIAMTTSPPPIAPGADTRG